VAPRLAHAERPLLGTVAQVLGSRSCQPNHPSAPPSSTHSRAGGIGRKGWLFSDTVKGAVASANLYSLVESAKANGVEPHAYLSLLFERLPTATRVEDFERLLPWNVKPVLAASTLPAVNGNGGPS
jgi:hypothetical protein